MNPRTEGLLRLLVVIAGALLIAIVGWWLFKTMIGGGLPAMIIFLFLLVAGGLGMHELTQRYGHLFLGRRFGPDDQGDRRP